MDHETRSSENDNIDSFTTHLNSHLTARIALEDLIAEVDQMLRSGSAHDTNWQEKIAYLNEMLTDYTAHSQLIVLPHAEHFASAKTMSIIEQKSIDNAVAISYLSNALAQFPHLTPVCFLLLSHFSDRLQIENTLLQSLRANPLESKVISNTSTSKSIAGLIPNMSAATVVSHTSRTSNRRQH